MKINRIATGLLILLACSQALVRAQDGPSQERPSNSLPDLVIQDARPIDSFTVRVVVANEGHPKHPVRAASVVLRIFDTGYNLLKEIKQITPAGLAKGHPASLAIGTQGQTLVGNRFDVEVDAANRISEANEKNNRTAKINGPPLRVVIALKTPVATPTPKPPPIKKSPPRGDISVGIQVTEEKGKQVIELTFTNVSKVPNLDGRIYTLTRGALVGAHRVTDTIATDSLPSLVPGAT